MSWSMASETDVESENEEARRADGLEILRHVAGLARREVRLRIHAAIVRPRMDVARARGDAQAAGATQALHERLRRREGRRQFTQLHERARLEEAVERLGRMITGRDDHRLLLERGIRVHEAVAVLAAHAANA